MKSSHWLVLYLLLSGVLILGSFQYDRQVRDAIVATQEKGWNKSEEGRFWGAVSKYGDWPQLMVFGGVFLVLAWRCKRTDWVQIVAAAMIASTAAGIFANASRLTTGRVRPRDEAKVGVGFHGPWHDGKLTIGNSKYNGYPSGHTATAVGFAAPFLFARPLIGIPLFFGALAIAWSRMQLGAHHLSDVVTSVLLALLTGWYVWKYTRSHGEAVWRWLVTRVSDYRKRTSAR